MKRCLFIANNYYGDPIGIFYLYTIMKNNGIYCNLVDAEKENLYDHLSDNTYDFFLFSVTSGDHPWFLNISKELKMKFPMVKVVCGGPHYTLFEEDGEKDENIDHYVVGCGEDVIIDIINGKYKTKRVFGQFPDFNTLPIPERDIWYKYDYYKNCTMKRFTSQRSCMYNCSYCHNHKFHKVFNNDKKIYQNIDPKKYVHEMKTVKEKYGLKLAILNDENILQDLDWFYEFTKEFERQLKYYKDGTKYFCFVRPDYVTEEIVKEMSRSGCYMVAIGVESGNDETKKLLRRGNATNETIINSCNLFHKYNIKIKTLQMIGLPLENSLQDALDTLYFNLFTLKPYYAACLVFQPCQGTDLYEYSIENGYLDTRNPEINNFRGKSLLKLNDKEKIENLSLWWNFILENNITDKEWIENVLLNIKIDDDMRKIMINKINKKVEEDYDV